MKLFRILNSKFANNDMLLIRKNKDTMSWQWSTSNPYLPGSSLSHSTSSSVVPQTKEVQLVDRPCKYLT